MKTTTVDEYINTVPEQAQAKLQEIRTILKKVVLNATEAVKWGFAGIYGKAYTVRIYSI